MVELFQAVCLVSAVSKLTKFQLRVTKCSPKHIQHQAATLLNAHSAQNGNLTLRTLGVAQIALAFQRRNQSPDCWTGKPFVINRFITLYQAVHHAFVVLFLSCWKCFGRAYTNGKAFGARYSRRDEWPV